MTGTAGDNIGNAAGGLIGHTYINVTLSDSYATGDVTGATGGSYVGGLIGDFSSVSTNLPRRLSITNCYATGDVSGTKSVGGLVGNNGGRDTISGSYATGEDTTATACPTTAVAVVQWAVLLGTNRTRAPSRTLIRRETSTEITEASADSPASASANLQLL